MKKVCKKIPAIRRYLNNEVFAPTLFPRKFQKFVESQFAFFVVLENSRAFENFYTGLVYKIYDGVARVFFVQRQVVASCTSFEVLCSRHLRVRLKSMLPGKQIDDVAYSLFSPPVK